MQIANFLKKIKPYWPIIFIAILVSFFFYDLFFPLKTFISFDVGRGDITHLNYPIKNLLAASLKKKTLPLWSEDVWSGFPYFSESQMGVFYLPNFILFSLLPTSLAFNLNYWLAFFITGIGVYLFTQSIGFKKLASSFSAISFSFSGFFVGHILHLNLLQAASLMPLLFYLTELFLKKKKLRNLLFLSLLISQQLFAGFPQITLYSLLGISIFFLFRIFSNLLSHKISTLNVLKYSSLFFGSCTFGFLLSAIQLLPTLEFLQLSTRYEGVGIYNLHSFPYHPKNLITFIFPYYFGNPSEASYPPFSENWGLFWENIGYVGILPLILTFIGIPFFLFKKDKNKFFPFFLFFLFLFVFSLIMTLGKYTPFFFINQIPPFIYFRMPSRFLFLTCFSLAILAGINLEKITSKIKFQTKTTPKALKIGFLIILIFDLFFFGKNYNPKILSENFKTTPKIAEFLKEKSNGDFFRIYTLGASSTWNKVHNEIAYGWKNNLELFLKTLNLLDPNLNMLHNLKTVIGYPSLMTRRLTLVYILIDQGIELDQQKNQASISPSALNTLSLFGARFIISSFDIKKPNLKKIFELNDLKDYPKIKVYENPFALPRVFLVSDYKEILTVSELIKTIEDEKFLPEKTVLLEKKFTHNPKLLEGSTAKVLSSENLKVKIEANLINDGFLVLADTYYPGWEVFIDGKKGEILAANLNQRAVFLKEGNHKVEFIYRPNSFRIGAIISLFSFALWTFLFIKLRKS